MVVRSEFDFPAGSVLTGTLSQQCPRNTIGKKTMVADRADGERKGALGDHQRRGQKYFPPMAQLPVMVTNGFRGDAPDFVWGLMLWAV